MINEYIKSNSDRFLKELMDWLRIPSVSADSSYKEHVTTAAKFIRDRLHEAGCDKANVFNTAGHPIVYGEKIVNPNLPTVLVYGHYDVQPPDPLDLWKSPPFEPVIKNDKIYARGATDDKGQAYMHVKAFETMMKLDHRPCNLKFLIEGEEEVGSSHLAKFIKENKSRLKADTVLISDTSLHSLETPTITTGLRGLSYVEVELTGPKRDLHSGVYGGAVANPINVLSKMIGSLIDDNGHITIPGFYDDVVALEEEKRALLNTVPFDMTAYKRELGLRDVAGEAGYTTFERTGIRPTLDVNGIWGGYIQEGAKTVLPSKAMAKISMRLVPNQNDETITELFTKHFQAIAPRSVKVKVTPMQGADPIVTPTDSPAYRAAENAIEEVLGKKPIPTHDGGSIPIVSLFKEELGLNSVLMGFGFDSDGPHSPNEHFGIKNFLMGIETIVAFYTHLKEVYKNP